MKKLILIIFLILSLPVSAGVTSENAADLIGNWKIYNSANTELASIDVTLAITKAGVSNFTYKTIGDQSSDDELLQGLMVNQNQVIFETLTPGESNTYVFDIDFAAGGGPGKLLRTVFADCETVGVDTSLVKSKYEKRLASSSKLCTEKATEESSLTDLKIVKDGTSASTISTTASVPSSFTSNLSTVAGQIESAWSLRSNSKNRDKIIVKETATNFLGYEFIYRIIGKKQKLKKLTETSFKSSERIGLVLDEYLVVNNSFFKKKNGLNVIDLNSKRRKGSGDYILTPNGDCFPSKSGASSTRVCTPNYDTSLANSVSKKSSKARAQRINTKTKISF